MYISIDRKPNNGCEIQDSACGRSKIMMRLKLVKTSTEEAADSIAEKDNGHLHGTKVLVFLLFLGLTLIVLFVQTLTLYQSEL